MKKNLLSTLLLLIFLLSNTNAQNKLDCKDLKAKIDYTFKNSTSIRASYSSRSRSIYLDYEVDSNANSHFIYRKTDETRLRYAFLKVKSDIYSLQSENEWEKGEIKNFNHEIWIDSITTAQKIFESSFKDCKLKEEIKITGTPYSIHNIVLENDTFDVWTNKKTNKLERIIGNLSKKNINLEWIFDIPFEVKIPLTGELATNQNFNFIVLPPSFVYDKNLDGIEPVYVSVDNQAEFKDGLPAMYKFLGSNIKYPKESRENGIEGTVYVGFVIEKDGSVSNVKVKRGIGGGCNQVALKVVESMNGKWNAGSHKGQKVRVAYTLPLKFKLE